MGLLIYLSHSFNGITCPGQTGQSLERVHCLSLSLIYPFNKGRHSGRTTKRGGGRDGNSASSLKKTQFKLIYTKLSR